MFKYSRAFPLAKRGVQDDNEGLTKYEYVVIELLKAQIASGVPGDVEIAIKKAEEVFEALGE